MRRIIFFWSLLLLGAVMVLPACAQSNPVFSSEKETFEAEIFAKDLDQPWAMARLPDGRFLVTEEKGRLRIIKDGVLLPEPVAGIPKVSPLKEGGLLDIVLHPDYAHNGWIYMAFGKPGPGGAVTSIARAKLDGNRLVDLETIFEPPAGDYAKNPDHFGSRIVFDKSNHLYFSIGDRGAWLDDGNPAQHLDRAAGKIHRLNDDGTIPEDNPFVKTPGSLPSIWSYGHRNPQGLSFQPGTGVLWEAEHGPRGGDELNTIRKGANYGWPLVSFGVADRGPFITPPSSAPGMEPPETHWTPCIAPSGIAFYNGSHFPAWKGNLFVCALAYQKLVRIELDAHNRVAHQEDLLRGFGRVRSVYTFDDDLYVVFDYPGVIIRLHPHQK